MAVKRVYPHVPQISDAPTQQSIKLLWDKVHDLTDQLTTAQGTITSHASTISSIQTSATKLANRVSSISLPTNGPIAKPTAFNQTGGTGTTAPGNNPFANLPAPPTGDFTSVVASFKASYIAAGKDVMDPCTRLQLMRDVGLNVDPTNAGWLIKFGGVTFLCTNSFGTFYASGLVWPNGQLIYCMTDDANATPQWGYGGADNGDRYFALSKTL